MTRAAKIRQARVYLTEVRRRRNVPQQRRFCFVLLAWAANARRRACAPEQFSQDNSYCQECRK